eukprot:scaffold4419_cov31-Tisochrysis_lutea.AAC.1
MLPGPLRPRARHRRKQVLPPPSAEEVVKVKPAIPSLSCAQAAPTAHRTPSVSSQIELELVVMLDDDHAHIAGLRV